jgi:hypothetical protein
VSLNPILSIDQATTMLILCTNSGMEIPRIASDEMMYVWVLLVEVQDC